MVSDLAKLFCCFIAQTAKADFFLMRHAFFFILPTGNVCVPYKSSFYPVYRFVVRRWGCLYGLYIIEKRVIYVKVTIFVYYKHISPHCLRVS